MKRNLIALVLISTLIMLTACSSPAEKTAQNPQRFTANFLGTFDAVVQVIGYTETEEDFSDYLEYIHQRFEHFHRLFDKYNDYEGINNIKTINDNAGKKPVQVEQEIIDLILLSKEWHGLTDGKVNIAVGSLLDIWDEKIKQAMSNPEQVTLPSKEELAAAAEHINIDNVIVDKEARTVFLAHENMSLDVGAIGKGFAAEVVGNEVFAMGFTSGVIISGGNWKALGKPIRDDRDHWTVAVQNPDKPYTLSEEGILRRIALRDESLDTGGDYQRFAYIEGLRVHHIIDPDTLMPGNYHRGVTVMTDRSDVADLISTGLFLLPYEKGRTLADSIEGVEALWVMPDGTIRATDGMLQRIIDPPK